MFIQIKALPPASRPQGLHPWMEENLYVSVNTDGYAYSPEVAEEAATQTYFYTLDEILEHKGWGQVVVTTENSHRLEQTSHTSLVSYWGYDGLIYLSHMVPRSEPGKFPMPKWEELVSPTA